MQAQKNYHRVFCLIVSVCLALGLATYPPAQGRVARADPPPPPAIEGEEGHPLPPPLPTQTPVDVPPPVEGERAPQPASRPVTRAEQEAAQLRAELAVFEPALRAGPQAVVALKDTLRGRALDLVMADIVRAQRQLALLTPPRPPTQALSPAEEAALVQAQTAFEAASRARALASHDDPAEDRPPAVDKAPDAPNRPAADLTVGSSPCTYATIGAAITAALAGDRLLIEGGVTFAEHLYVNKSLTLQGGYNGCGSGSAAYTTLDGSNSGRVFEIYGGADVILENLNITNGNSEWGGGIRVSEDSDLYGTNLEIYNNTATVYGGGLRVWGARATFTNTNIQNNVAPLGGGVYGTPYNAVAPALDLPSYADVYNNNALTGDGFGGGVYMQQGTILLNDCSDIYYNDAIEGGGAYLVTSTLTIYGDCSEVMYNTATGNGGGIRAQGSTINLMVDAELFYNTAGYGTDAGNGGGAYLDNSTLWGDKGLIYYNTADDYGGGVYIANNSELDMDLGGYACSGPRCSQLSYNTALDLYGGGVYANNGYQVDLIQTFVEGNTADYGGGVYAYQTSVYLYNDLLANNDAGSNTGDGLRLSSGSSLTGSDNTWAYNDAGGAATGNAIAIFNASLSLSNSIVWGHATSLDDAAQTIACSNIQGGYAGTDNMDVDPLFVDPASANFHLQSLSPVIDRCSTGQGVDFDNDPRPVTYVRPATPYDMGADEAAPRVGLNGGGCAYGRIQDAVDAAVSGDTIQAATDVFPETVTIDGKDLLIAGGYAADCATYITSTTTVNGSDYAGYSVFNIYNSALTLRDLDITGGSGGTGGGVNIVYSGSGDSQVTLDSTDVFGNQAGYGGGVYVDVGNTLTTNNQSYIHHNTASYYGGGARVWGTFVGGETFSDIDYNSAPDGGGAAVPSGGRLILHDSDMAGNQATGAEGRGGGIYVYGGGVVTATNNTWIHNNNTAYDGAGIYADNARVYLNYVTVGTNVATHHGGGVYLANGSRLDTHLATISYAGYGNQANYGAGLYVNASTLNFNGSIMGNSASYNGGGLYADGSALILNDAQVGDTYAGAPNRLSNSGNGAGLYLSGTHASLVNTVVASNTFPAGGWGYGGGLYLQNGSVVTLTGSTVEYHLAPSASSARGAGMYVWDSTVTLSNSQVLSNTSEAVGGGLRLWGDSTLNILGGSELRNNQALNGEGGAVAADDGTASINVVNSTLQNNVASGNGGAIYLNGGALNFTGWWNILNNTAGGNGGAVAVAAGSAAFRAGGGVSYLYNNAAGGNGGALYTHDTGTLPLYATQGYPLVFAYNYAGGNGGGAYADSGAMFDTYGRVWIVYNRAAGNGGAYYLSGGSRLWLDDYVNDKPEVRVNWAQNGGAVYAQNSPRVQCDGAEVGYDPSGNYTTNGNGGAFYLGGSTFNAFNCTLYNNQATAYGGAIAAYTSTLTIGAQYTTLAAERSEAERGTEAMLAPTACDPLSGQCSSFYGNTADSSSGYGGALYLDGSTLSMDHTYLHRNSAERGGAIYQNGASSTAWMSNTLFYSNTSASGVGAGVRMWNSVMTATHTTFAHNAGSAVANSGGTAYVFNSLAWGNTGGFGGADASSSCNIDQDGLVGLNVDPEFIAPGAGEDYHLLGSSPAIDMCTTGLSPDLDNITRHVGCGYDVGAYEYASTDPLTVVRAVGPGEHTFGGTGVRIDFTNIGSLTEVTVTLAHTYPTLQGAPRPLPRRVEITGDATDFTANLTLCYADNEVTDEGIASENDLRLYRYAGVPTWTEYIPSAIDTTLNRITAATAEFSVWAIGAVGHEPTRVGLVSLHATGGRLPVAALLLGLLLTGACVWVIKRRKR